MLEASGVPKEREYKHKIQKSMLIIPNKQLQANGQKRVVFLNELMSPKPNRTMREILTEIPNKDIQSQAKIPGYLSATQS